MAMMNLNGAVDHVSDVVAGAELVGGVFVSFFGLDQSKFQYEIDLAKRERVRCLVADRPIWVIRFTPRNRRSKSDIKW